VLRTVADQRRAIMAAPDDWTGQQVRVGFDMRGDSGGTVGELAEVSERGIVLRHDVVEGARPIFYPWKLVV
jgi:hypothetical protein